MIAGSAIAQEVTLRLHQFLPPQSTVPADILDPWADKIEAASEGRIKIDRFPSMQLGGRPPELIDQAMDGVVDIIWTVVGYTPGRFPSTEVFELPFFIEDAGVASCAFSSMYEEHMAQEFQGIKMLGTWVHGPGHFHTKTPVETPADLNGMKIRGGSRLVNKLLEAAGATPVGMPVPAVPEALSKGVIDGATVPWEVTPALKIPELVQNHTEFTGNALYVLTFALAMNENSFNRVTQQAADGPARASAAEMGNNIVTVTDTAPWRALVDPIYDEWVADVADRGIDGQALIDEARDLMENKCAGAAL